MKDFVSKLTFSFLMAQLFPGAVATFAVGFIYFTWDTPQPDSVLASAQNLLNTWGNATIPQQLFLVGLCIGAGMSIHGLHWTVLGAQEKHNGGAVYLAPFHHKSLWQQVIGAPTRLVTECVYLFFNVHDIRKASMDENVTNIDKDHIEQFNFLQEFYLAPGQFFMHMAYASMIVLFGAVSFMVAYGITWRRLVLVALAYLLIGVFFLLGRVQLRSLFRAEEELTKRSAACGALASVRCDDERLLKLKDLLQKGLISQEEHDQRKDAILDKV